MDEDATRRGRLAIWISGASVRPARRVGERYQNTLVAPRIMSGRPSEGIPRSRSVIVGFPESRKNLTLYQQPVDWPDTRTASQGTIGWHVSSLTNKNNGPLAARRRHGVKKIGQIHALRGA